MDQIIIYGTVNCPKCSVAKSMFSSHSVQYQFVDLTQQPDKLEEITAKIWPNTSMPVIQIGEAYKSIQNANEIQDLLVDLIGAAALKHGPSAMPNNIGTGVCASCKVN